MKRRAPPYESMTLTQFSDLGLAEAILRAVTAEGYKTPTPIQAKVIPAMTGGADVVGIAQTGTGKTASFVLPLLHRLAAKGRPRPAPRHGGALILVPTRELAAQIGDSIARYGRFLNLSHTVIVGGARPGPQVKAMARGIDIVIATPGRLLDHMGTGAVRLDETTAVVLDEADQMLDLGFMPAIRKIMRALPKQRQTVLLSATMPKQIRALADDFLKNPTEIAVAPASRPIERIDQSVMHVTAEAKRAVLTELLRNPDIARAIVFTRTKRGADKVSAHLEKAGLSSAAIHGNKSQSQRQRALHAFRTGTITILIATDIAARGIDVDDVSHVVNFELPNVPESYVHRIGRTARAGKSGRAIALCDRSERGLLRDIERLIGRSLPTEKAEAIEGIAVVDDTPPPPRKPASRPAKKQAAAQKTSAADKPKPAHRRRHKPAPKTPRPAAATPDRPDTGLARMLGSL